MFEIIKDKDRIRKAESENKALLLKNKILEDALLEVAQYISEAKLYLKKINNGEVNALTGEVWKLEDVPMLWRAEVEALLEEQDE
jgi:hypothetical protein